MTRNTTKRLKAQIAERESDIRGLSSTVQMYSRQFAEQTAAVTGLRKENTELKELLTKQEFQSERHKAIEAELQKSRGFIEGMREVLRNAGTIEMRDSPTYPPVAEMLRSGSAEVARDAIIKR